MKLLVSPGVRDPPVQSIPRDLRFVAAGVRARSGRFALRRRSEISKTNPTRVNSYGHKSDWGIALNSFCASVGSRSKPIASRRGGFEKQTHRVTTRWLFNANRDGRFIRESRRVAEDRAGKVLRVDHASAGSRTRSGIFSSLELFDNFGADGFCLLNNLISDPHSLLTHSDHRDMHCNAGMKRVAGCKPFLQHPTSCPEVSCPCRACLPKIQRLRGSGGAGHDRLRPDRLG